MSMDPLEKELFRRKMATRMQVILEGAKSVVCVSGHYNEEPAYCELCQQTHAQEMIVIRNRANKNFHVAESCLREMVRFQVTDAEDLGKWLGKMKELRAEYDRRKADQERAREEERKRLEKKVIVRRREPQSMVKA